MPTTTLPQIAQIDLLFFFNFSSYIGHSKAPISSLVTRDPLPKNRGLVKCLAVQDLLLPFLQIVSTCFDTALFFYNIVNSARIHLIFISVETGGKGLRVEFYRSD